MSSALAFTAVLLVPAAQAADTLSAGANGATAVWGTNSNWQDNSFPISSDDVVFDYSNGATTTVVGLDAVQAANSVTFGSSSGTALGAFTLRANTAATTARTFTLTTGNITVDSSVTGTQSVGDTANGNLTLATSAAGYTFTNNNTTQALNVTTLFTSGKALTLTTSGGAINIDTQLGAPTFASLDGGSSVTTITNGGASIARIITLNGTGNHSFAGIIQNGATATNALTVNNASLVQTLTGNNTYTGATTLTAGTLNINAAGSGGTSSAIGTGAFSIGAGTTINNTTANAIILSTANAVTFAGGTAVGFTFSGTKDLSFANGTVNLFGGGTGGNSTTKERIITLDGTNSTLAFGSASGTDWGTNQWLLTVNNGAGSGNTLTFKDISIGGTNVNLRSFTIGGSANVTSGAITVNTGSGASDPLNYSGTGTLTLTGANTVGNGGTGLTTIRSGTVVLNNATPFGGTAGTNNRIVFGDTAASSTAAANLLLGGTDTGGSTGEVTLIRNVAAQDTTSGLLTLGGKNTSGTNTYSGIVTLGATTNTGKSVTLVAAAGGQVDFTGAIVKNGTNTTAGITAGTSGNTGLVKLSGANTYGGTTTVNFGTLQFANGRSLYNSGASLSASVTAANITVASGATLALSVDSATASATTGFTAAEVQTIAALGTGSGGFQSGSKLGLDTSTATGGTFTYGNVLADTNSGANTVGLTKLGTGTLALTNTNTYTGATAVNAGTLNISSGSSLATGSAVTVQNTGSTLSGSGTVNGNINIKSGAVLAAGDSGGTAIGILTASTGSNTLTLESESIFAWGLAGSTDTDSGGVRGADYDAVDAANVSADSNAIFRVILGTIPLADMQTPGNTYWSQTQTWSNIFSSTFSGFNSPVQVFNASGTDVSNTTSLYGSFTANGSTLTWAAVPEPATHVMAGLMIGAGLLRRRRNLAR